jgi:polar amino acid transport system substrate-binding protein
MQTNGAELPNNISIASDHWCPYVCDLESDKPGYLVEVSNFVFEKLGVEPFYHALGWQKAIDLVEKSQVHAIIAAGTTNHGKTILSREILGIDRTVLVMRKDQPFNNKQIFQALNSMILGVIVDYTYDFNGPLDNYITQRKRSNDRIVTLNHNLSVQALFVMLNRSSIDIFPENILVAHYMAESMGIVSDLDLHTIERHDHMYLAFSPDPIGENLRDAFDHEVRLLKKSGGLEVIMNRYGIVDTVTNHEHQSLLENPLDN